jgi:beta-lactam-binding protein with PASTA domain
MRVAYTVALVMVLLLAAPVAAPAYTNGGPSQALIEMEERNAREGAEQAAKDKQEHEAAEKREREARENPPSTQPPPQEQSPAPEASAESTSHPTVQCVVPSLKGDSLGAAQNALRKSHCRLGKVSRPRTHRGALVVIGQGARSGTSLAGGAAVAITLGAVRAKHSRS